MADPLEASEVRGFLQGLTDALANSPAPETLEKCRPVTLQGVRDNFNSSADPDNIDWPPRKPNPKDDGHPLLIDTGALMQAATGGGAGSIKENDGRQLAVGVDSNTIPYAAIHNFGGKRTPQREYMGVDDEIADQIAEIIEDNILLELVGE